MKIPRLSAASAAIAAVSISFWPSSAHAFTASAVPKMEAPLIGGKAAVPVPLRDVSLSQVSALRLTEVSLPAANANFIQALEAAKSAPLAAQSAARPALESLAPNQVGVKATAAEAVYDGEAARRSVEAAEPILTPSFEPPTQTPSALKGGGFGDSGGGRGGSGRGGNGGGNGNGRGGGDDNGDEGGLRPLSFPNQAQVARLQSFDPNQMLYGILKRIRPSPVRPKWAKDRPRDPNIPANSREAWGRYKVGSDVGIVSRGESVFGDRKTKITEAYFKKISKLTREDLKGVFPAAELLAPIAQIRKAVVDRLEEDRRQWKPGDPPVTADVEVRVIKFKSFAQLFREENGPDAIPKPEPPKPRAPLQTVAEGKLTPMASFLPRAVYLDVDALEGPAGPELLSDMMKLQRTGVYFVAFSRKPYDAPGGVHDKLVRRMSPYQLSILLPIRFMAVTDDGNVVMEFPRGGNPKIVSAARLSGPALDVLADAAQKSSELVGLAPRAMTRVVQPEKPGPKEQPLRFELAVGKSVTAAQLDAWLVSLRSRLAQQGLSLSVKVSEKDGARLITVMQGQLGGSFDRLQSALGDKFGLYVNPSDLLVLSDDPEVLKANPHLDFGAVTGLKGQARVENALGLLLGEHRDNVAGDLSGSASRVSQFRRDRTRYMSEFLIKQDGQEQNINFYSGHVVHATNDWLIWSLQNARRPTPQEYEANLRQRWEGGLHDIKAVGLPQGEDMAGWVDSRVAGALNMYREVVAAHDRGEVLVGAEIPNFFMLKDRQKRTGNLKRRYTVHTIFDFIALRPDPKNPGHATLVIYDFKTGPAQSRQKLEQDIQVLTYSLFAKLRWQGKEFPTPYFSGDKPYVIDDVAVEFIYNAIRQPTTVGNRSLDKIRKTIVTTLNGIFASEQKMLGLAPVKKAVKKGAKASPKGKSSSRAKPTKKKPASSKK